jgi:beta-lactamase regulating signal transducer with metallopeptidase domain
VTPLATLGLGMSFGWLVLPWLVRLARTPAAPAAWCHNLRVVLIGTAMLPLLVTVQLMAPDRALPKLPAVLHVEAWVLPTQSAHALQRFPLRFGIQQLFGVLGCLWLCLLVAGTWREVRRNFAARRLRDSALPAPWTLQHVCALAAARYALRTPEVRICAALECAGTVGIFEPVILCPPADLDLDPASLELLMCHEVCHVHRRDSWWRPFELVAESTLHGHPSLKSLRDDLALAREAAVDREASADAPSAYAALLLTMAERQVSARELGLVSSVGTAIERRLEMLFKPTGSSKNSRWISVLGSLAAGALLAPAAFAERGEKPFNRAMPPPEVVEPKVTTDVDACYEKALEEDEDLVVDTVAQLRARATGEIVEANIPSSSAVFQTCIEARALGWRFPLPADAPPPPPDARLMIGFPIQRSPK